MSHKHMLDWPICRSILLTIIETDGTRQVYNMKSIVLSCSTEISVMSVGHGGLSSLRPLRWIWAEAS